MQSNKQMSFHFKLDRESWSSELSSADCSTLKDQRQWLHGRRTWSDVVVVFSRSETTLCVIHTDVLTALSYVGWGHTVQRIVHQKTQFELWNTQPVKTSRSDTCASTQHINNQTFFSTSAAILVIRFFSQFYQCGKIVTGVAVIGAWVHIQKVLLRVSGSPNLKIWKILSKHEIWHMKESTLDLRVSVDFGSPKSSRFSSKSPPNFFHISRRRICE